jgi:hypothetical protein
MRKSDGSAHSLLAKTPKKVLTAEAVSVAVQTSTCFRKAPFGSGFLCDKPRAFRDHHSQPRPQPTSSFETRMLSSSGLRVLHRKR